MVRTLASTAPPATDRPPTERPITPIYLDNAATTAVDAQVVEAMLPCLTEEFGNPSSLHRLGLTAERQLRRSREQVAAALCCTPPEVIFTSGGTEADALAVLGLAAVSRGRHAVASAIEHPAVFGALGRLEDQGWTVARCPVDGSGVLDLDALAAVLRPETALLCVMLVNNETGMVQPVAEAARLARRCSPSCRIHVDAVQALCKLPLRVDDLDCDTLAVSGHKLHAPKGIGALYLRRGLRLAPIFGAGRQEHGLRPGTENVASIVGLGKAIELGLCAQGEAVPRMRQLLERLLAAVLSAVPGTRAIGDAQRRAPHIASLVFPKTRSEVLLHALEARGLYVSAGSACHSRERAPSQAQRAMGVKSSDGVVRVSVARTTTVAEIAAAIAILTEVAGRMRQASAG